MRTTLSQLVGIDFEVLSQHERDLADELVGAGLADYVRTEYAVYIVAIT